MKNVLMAVMAVFVATATLAQQARWVDLGLPSGTLWYSYVTSVRGELYAYAQLKEELGDNLPTKEQYEELLNYCEWQPVPTVKYWHDKASPANCWMAIGPNGNKILFDVDRLTYGGCGVFLSRTKASIDEVYALCWEFDKRPYISEVDMDQGYRCRAKVRKP